MNFNNLILFCWTMNIHFTSKYSKHDILVIVTIVTYLINNMKKIVNLILNQMNSYNLF